MVAIGSDRRAEGHLRAGLRVYPSGDTAWFDGFEQIGARCGAIDAAMLPIGAYAPRWFMRSQHMDPADAVRAFTALGATRFIAMHWGTFKLTDEDLREPPELLREVWQRANLADARLARRCRRSGRRAGRRVR